MKRRTWLISLLVIVSVMLLVVNVGITESFFLDDEQSTDDALSIRWGLFVLNDGFEGTPWDDYWNENGTTTWVQDSATPHTGSYNAFISDAQTPGYLTSDEIEASTADNITLSFWFNLKNLEAGDCLVQTYNGTAYNTWYDLINYPTFVNNTWCEFNEVITDSQYLIAGFRLRFNSSALGGSPEEANIDDVIITTDTIPPAAPTGLVATGGDEEISLDWDSNNETDLWGYNVYRSLTGGANYTQINGTQVITSDYTDSGLYGGGTYYYVVTAADYGNNESGYSNEDSANATDVAPAAPTVLAANATEFQVSLAWNANIEGDLEGYNIYRGLTSGNYTKIESLWTTSNYTNTGLTNGVTYYYVVTAVDNATNDSGYSNEDSVTPVDVPPSAPAGLAATPGNEEISLDWDDNTEVDIAGYNVYRGTTPVNCTDKIGNLVETSNYTDIPIYGTVTYYYVVTAVDYTDPNAYESSNSTEVNATTIDVAPEAPAGLVATQGDEEISLDWDDNTEGDLDGYNVYRGTSPGNCTDKIGNLVATSNYTDTPLYGGGTYYYVVTAVDFTDPVAYQSANSTEVNATALNISPAIPGGLTAISGDELITLDWNDNIEGDLEGYNIYRGLTSGNYTKIESLWTSSNYTDTGLVFDTYYYVVTAVDNATNESLYSDEVSATPNDIAPAAPTGLVATAGDGEVSLDWNDNTEPDLDGYNVYRGLTSGNYTQINVGLVETSNYTSIGLTNGVTYYYVVRAVDTADPVAYESDNSNEDSATPQIPPQTLLDDGFEGDPWDTNWDGNGITDWIQVNWNVHNDSYAAQSGSGDTYLTTDDLDTSTVDNITISFWFRIKLLTAGPVYVQTYNGSSYVNQHDLCVYPGATATVYCYYSENITDSQYLRSDFRLRFDRSGCTTDVYIDDVLLTTNSLPPAAPTGLVATQGDTTASLNWTDNTEPDLNGYNIYRGTASGNYTKIENLWSSSNYTDTGRTNDVTYYYVVTAVDLGSNESGYSNEDSVTPTDLAPAVPTGLVATPGENEVDLDWDDNTDYDLAGYNVYRSLTSGDNYTQIETLWSSSNYTDTGLTNGVTYYYVVTAVDTANPYAYESDNSSEVNATPLDLPPAAPTGLFATPLDTEVTLDWVDNAEGDLAGYNIYRSLTSGNYTTPIESLWASSNYTDTGLTNGVKYYYVVRAEDNGTNESGNSNEANATPGNAPPAKPTGLTANAGNEYISINWTANGEPDLVSYNIYRSPTSGNYTYRDNVIAPISNYTDSPLYGGTYFYVVSAVDNVSGESVYSDYASATAINIAPAAPTNLSANAGDEQITLDWDDNSEGDLAGYNVYRGLTSGNYTKIESLWASSNYTDTGLTNGVTYYYVVTAVDDGSNESSDSNEDSARPASPPQTLLDDNFEGTPWDGYWDDNFATDWAISYLGGGYNSDYSAAHGSGDTYLTSDDLDASGVDNITVSFWFNIKLLNKGPLYIQTYNGTAYNTWFDLVTYPGVVKTTWIQFSETTTDSQYFKSNFRIRFDSSGISTDARIDDVLVKTNQ